MSRPKEAGVKGKKPIKEINLKIEKVGVVHYFALTSKDELDPQVCKDCGKTFTFYSKVMWGKKDKEGKLLWKVVCNKCLENYRTKDLDQSVETKLGKYNGEPIFEIFKPYKPHLSKCYGCKQEHDIKNKPMYRYKGEYYCTLCLKVNHEIDYTKRIRKV